ncbi:MAG: glycosyltransferase [Magnetococcus sp. THC-1_WYH]
MPSILYLTRNGLLEPLGQSQVFSYLRGLAKIHRITLITYEKKDDWADAQRVAALRTECERLGIRWLPQRFRPHPKVIAPAFSMVRMVWLVAREVKRQDVGLIHARSYIPAAVALVVSRFTGVPFIFDMRALWPEELLTAGRLRRGSLIHKAIVAAERTCLRYAAAVVSLTHAAVEHLQREYPNELSGQQIVVIPTCADLGRFVPAPQQTAQPVIGCLGTVLSGWFRLDWLAAFLAVAAQRNPTLRFELTTRDNPDHVRAAIGADADLQARMNIAPCASDQVHKVIQVQTASVMFYTQRLSEIGRSPTRMGEVLGCGIPVVVNEGVGDVAHIVRKHRVGVLVAGGSVVEMEAAWDELQRLLADPGLATRCRQAAEEVFSLETGTAAYGALYAKVLENRGSRSPRMHEKKHATDPTL